MKKTELESLIEQIVQKKLQEDKSVFVVGLYDNKTSKQIKTYIDSFIDTLEQSEGYKNNEAQYKDIISDLNKLYNVFDSKFRKLIEPIKNDYL